MATYTQAAKTRWKKVLKEERTQKMKELALMRWSKTSKKQRREYAMLMVEARRKKHA